MSEASLKTVDLDLDFQGEIDFETFYAIPCECNNF